MENNNLNIFAIIIFLLIVVFLMGYDIGKREKEEENNLEEKYEFVRDSIFLDYKKKADLYLSRSIFKDTPLNGSILSHSARLTYYQTGILVPVELALSQAQMESSMGTRGKSPLTNPFNIGEWDEGTVIKFTSKRKGIDSYYKLIANKYLSCRNLDELFVNFISCDGYRYASSDYETEIKKQYYFVKRYIDKNI
jgi:hypothetical protein